MKIISNFKDYYDWVAQRYGGGDPLNVWLRRDTTNPDMFGLGVTFPDLEVPDTGLSSYSWREKDADQGWELDFCVLNGVAYPTVRKWTGRLLEKEFEPYKVLRPNSPFVDFYLKARDPSRYYQLSAKQQIQDWLNPTVSPHLIKISQLVHQPAFVITGPNSVSGQLPRLGELGFAALFSAEQTYQNLSYFVGNYLRDSADLNPPAAVSDRDRIVQHGFDLKRSFRN